MTEKELSYEHRVVYQTRINFDGNEEPPSAWLHNIAVDEANESRDKLRKENGLVARLKSFRENL